MKPDGNSLALKITKTTNIRKITADVVRVSVCFLSVFSYQSGQRKREWVSERYGHRPGADIKMKEVFRFLLLRFSFISFIRYLKNCLHWLFLCAFLYDKLDWLTNYTGKQKTHYFYDVKDYARNERNPVYFMKFLYLSDVYLCFNVACFNHLIFFQKEII